MDIKSSFTLNQQHTDIYNSEHISQVFNMIPVEFEFCSCSYDRVLSTGGMAALSETPAESKMAFIRVKPLQYRLSFNPSPPTHS